MSAIQDTNAFGAIALRPNWTARSAVLVVVILLHIVFVTWFRSVPLIESALPSFVATEWIDAPRVDRPRHKLTPPAAGLQLESWPLPVVPVPEIVIEDTLEFAVNNPALTTALPSPQAAGTGNRSSMAGGNSGAGSQGVGASEGGNAFTHCREVKAAYPDESVRNNEQGQVILVGELSEYGAIDSIVVATSSGSRQLDAAAVAALKRWKCSPVIQDGRPVRARGKQEFNFSITTITKTLRK